MGISWNYIQKHIHYICEFQTMSLTAFHYNVSNCLLFLSQFHSNFVLFVTILMHYIVVLRPCLSLAGIKYIKQNKAKEIYRHLEPRALGPLGQRVVARRHHHLATTR